MRGIGDKGATELLLKYKNLENIYEHLGEIGGPCIKIGRGARFRIYEQKARDTDSATPIDFDLSACRMKDLDISSVQNLFGKLGFKSLQKRLADAFSTHYEQEVLF